MARLLTVLAIVAAAVGDATAQTRPAETGSAVQAPSGPGAAYYEFLLARHLDSDGDLDGAVAALQRAARLDPASSEIQADLAGLFIRLNRPADALAAGQAALKNDPDNVTANRVLGSIYASLTQGPRTPPAALRANAELAIRHLEKGDPESSPSVQLLLGRLYVQVENWDRAIAVLSRFVEEEPGVSEALSLLAQAYDGAGRGRDAIALLEDNAEASAQLSVMLGELYQREQRWADAAAAYDRAAQRRPRDQDLKVRLATALINVGTTPALQRAGATLREAISADRSHARAGYLLVQVERSLVNAAGAERAARDMLAASPDSIWGKYALAQVLADRRNYRGVIGTLGPVVEGLRTGKVDSQGLDPVRAYEQVAQAYHGLEQYDRAVDLFEQARGLAPGDLRLTRLEAETLRAAGQLDRGLQLMEQFVQRNDRLAAGYVSLAELYVDGGRVPQALAVIERAAASVPGDTSVAFGVGNHLERTGHYDEAERVFQALLATSPDHVETLNSLGYMLAVRGERLEESVGYITRALEFEPDNPAIIDSLGWAYFKLDQLDLAERHLRRAAADLASNSVVQDHLGDALFRRGNVEEAIVAWERALAGDGDQVDLSAIERKLRTARDKTRK